MELLVKNTEPAGKGESTITAKGPHLAGTSNNNGKAHKPLDNEHANHHTNGPVLAETVVVNLSHGLTSVGAKSSRNIRVHRSSNDGVNDETKNTASRDRANDTKGNSDGSVGSFFSHVDTGVEGTNGPNGESQASIKVKPLGHVYKFSI